MKKLEKFRKEMRELPMSSARILETDDFTGCQGFDFFFMKMFFNLRKIVQIVIC